jgi:hypothetical protein
VDTDEEISTQRTTTLRRRLIILIIMLLLIRPNMVMNALHHMEAMIGMDAGPAL